MAHMNPFLRFSRCTTATLIFHVQNNFVPELSLVPFMDQWKQSSDNGAIVIFDTREHAQWVLKGLFHSLFDLEALIPLIRNLDKIITLESDTKLWTSIRSHPACRDTFRRDTLTGSSFFSIYFIRIRFQC